MGISLKNDYSYLFNSMNKSSGAGALSDMSWLSDYASIKSGAYGRLIKAYYASDESDDKTKAQTLSKLTNTNVKQTSDETKAYTQAASGAEALTKSIDNIAKLDADADEDKLYEAANAYVKSYNDVVDTASATADKSITNRLTSVRTTTAANEKVLNKLGISIGNDGKLSIDKDTFKAADKSNIRELFGNRGSYGAAVRVSAEMIRSTADYDSARSDTYTPTGSYSSVVGSLWDSTT